MKPDRKKCSKCRGSGVYPGTTLVCIKCGGFGFVMNPKPKQPSIDPIKHAFYAGYTKGQLDMRKVDPKAFEAMANYLHSRTTYFNNLLKNDRKELRAALRVYLRGVK